MEELNENVYLRYYWIVNFEELLEDIDDVVFLWNVGINMRNILKNGLGKQ